MMKISIILLLVGAAPIILTLFQNQVLVSGQVRFNKPTNANSQPYRHRVGQLNKPSIRRLNPLSKPSTYRLSQLNKPSSYRLGQIRKQSLNSEPDRFLLGQLNDPYRVSQLTKAYRLGPLNKPSLIRVPNPFDLGQPDKPSLIREPFYHVGQLNKPSPNGNGEPDPLVKQPSLESINSEQLYGMSFSDTQYTRPLPPTSSKAKEDSNLRQRHKVTMQNDPAQIREFEEGNKENRKKNEKVVEDGRSELDTDSDEEESKKFRVVHSRSNVNLWAVIIIVSIVCTIILTAISHYCCFVNQKQQCCCSKLCDYVQIRTSRTATNNQVI